MRKMKSDTLQREKCCVKPRKKEDLLRFSNNLVKIVGNNICCMIGKFLSKLRIFRTKLDISLIYLDRSIEWIIVFKEIKIIFGKRWSVQK